ncbi:40851_t:CDS:1, partial [Gigaspora margarita]
YRKITSGIKRKRRALLPERIIRMIPQNIPNLLFKYSSYIKNASINDLQKGWAGYSRRSSKAPPFGHNNFPIISKNYQEHEYIVICMKEPCHQTEGLKRFCIDDPEQKN